MKFFGAHLDFRDLPFIALYVSSGGNTRAEYSYDFLIRRIARDPEHGAAGSAQPGGEISRGNSCDGDREAAPRSASGIMRRRDRTARLVTNRRYRDDDNVALVSPSSSISIIGPRGTVKGRHASREGLSTFVASEPGGSARLARLRSVYDVKKMSLRISRLSAALTKGS